MLKIISSLFTLASVSYGAYYVSLKHPEVKTKVMDLIYSGNFHTLEARLSAKQIMEGNRKRLLKDDRHTFLEPITLYSPLLLLEIKYTRPDHTTGEGLIFWDLIDGEMVMNTEGWDKTHGYADCIKSRLTKNEFKVINLLAERGGALDRGTLVRLLSAENETLDKVVDSCRKKKLIVLTGNQYRLHLKNPKISVIPETIIDDHLVTKSLKNAQRLNHRFSEWQIRQVAESTFGADFAIRSTMTVYLPTYSITVGNPDGTFHTSYWNAISGKEIPFSSMIE
ncbi:MAG: hypothetical protein ACOYK9_06585 [Chlamydiia bacterium]